MDMIFIAGYLGYEIELHFESILNEKAVETIPTGMIIWILTLIILTVTKNVLSKLVHSKLSVNTF